MTEGVPRGGSVKNPKNVFWLGLTSLLTDVSSEMIFPILPIFLTGVLRAPMPIVGVIEGIAEATASIFKYVSGRVSDKVKRRKTLTVFGYSFSAVSKPFFALSFFWWHVLVFRFLDRVGKGIRTSPRDALIKESVDEERIGRSFGLHRAMDTFGAIAGTIIVSVALFTWGSSAEHLRNIFWLSFIPAALAVFCLVVFVKEPRRGGEESAFPPQMLDAAVKPSVQDAGFRGEADGRPLVFSKNFKLLLVAAAIFALGNFSYAFFILRAQDAGTDLAFIPLVYLLYNASYAAAAYPIGRLSDRIGRTKVLIAGFVLFSLTNLGFAFGANAYTVWILFALYGIFVAAGDTIFRALVADLAPLQQSGKAFGAYHLVAGLAALPANFFGGILWQDIGKPAPFIFAAATSAVAIIPLALLGNIERQKRIYGAEQFKGYR
ncbi:MAG: hypothetical protein A2939_03765 [Parcubacteria group bacterium RIFCSPLOWO2_01_FULL_48_18]|nr:MAG: hypothetical protein A3J67_02705 [Parcubacteria group bacterium RIFCSPHIGHO2_02_FULL_48_10b]OHB22394.1 MAG: hypothetical protein A2939_03765 [Parcubacteria group bacterium RIFCSPLOWO2_01_FULL_48_18]